jgi:hypothetical protein
MPVTTCKTLSQPTFNGGYELSTCVKPVFGVSPLSADLLRVTFVEGGTTIYAALRSGLGRLLSTSVKKTTETTDLSSSPFVREFERKYSPTYGGYVLRLKTDPLLEREVVRDGSPLWCLAVMLVAVEDDLNIAFQYEDYRTLDEPWFAQTYPGVHDCWKRVEEVYYGADHNLWHRALDYADEIRVSRQAVAC